MSFDEDDDFLPDVMEQYTPEDAAIDRRLAEIEEMKLLGLPKPPDVSYGDWYGPKDISARHELIIQMTAAGMTQKAIAQDLGMSEPRVCQILNNSKVRQRVKKRQDQLWGSDARKRLQNMLGRALDVADQLISNENTKENVRADLVKYVIDQSLGKAKQEVDVKGSLLSEVFHKLEQMDAAQIKDVEPADEFDAQLDSIVGDGLIIGQRREED